MRHKLNPEFLLPDSLWFLLSLLTTIKSSISDGTLLDKLPCPLSSSSTVLFLLPRLPSPWQCLNYPHGVSFGLWALCFPLCPKLSYEATRTSRSPPSCFRSHIVSSVWFLHIPFYPVSLYNDTGSFLFVTDQSPVPSSRDVHLLCSLMYLASRTCQASAMLLRFEFFHLRSLNSSATLYTPGVLEVFKPWSEAFLLGVSSSSQSMGLVMTSTHPVVTKPRRSFVSFMSICCPGSSTVSQSVMKPWLDTAIQSWVS